MPKFIPGLELGHVFYNEAVKPILSVHAPRLLHSAAIIGSGSEVLGFDTEMSTDHHWGPRVMLFLTPEDHQKYREFLQRTFADHLPLEIGGYPTNFSAPDPDDGGTQLLEKIENGPVNHRVEIYTLNGFLQGYLGFGDHHRVTPADWLSFPMQKLRGLTAGAVYHDDLGLESIRARFAWYPMDVWRYQLAAGWSRIGQDEHLMGRAGYAGDALGAGIIGSRLVREIMRLCFLMEKQYPPYPKWFGTAFKQLKCAQALLPNLLRARLGETWQEIEGGLSPAYETIARMHNALKLTKPLPEKVSSFHGRPFMVIHGDGFASALAEGIHDPEVKRLTQGRIIGSLDLISDSTDLLEATYFREKIRAFYQS